MRHPILVAAAILASQAVLAQQSNSPSLKDTLEWMRTTVSDHAKRKVFVDQSPLLRRKEEAPGLMSERGPDYNEDGVDVRKGDHVWQWTRDEIDISYEGCALTIKEFGWVTDPIKRSSRFGVLEYVHPEEHISSHDKFVVNLGEFNPDSVTATGPFVSDREKPSFVNPRFSAKGLPYLLDNGAVSAKRTDEKGMDLLLIMEYPFCERFAKALKTAIRKCGGKAPPF